ncbi:hypothetical protein [Bowmanella pacifica]|uniref:Uncharacterized protein n=1 Tax=Bowmanella pacifica TaxID=502051 RepID=A0A917YQS4_9ALTE|nr:hypothetical protein [Bowmanella pacifica]GGO63749.1 hypothetical protein GCM10010982_01510 [Bowmanella pacifica]
MRIPLFKSWHTTDWICKAIGGAFLALAFYGIAEFPVFKLLMLGLGVAYAFLLIVFPLSWLLVVPLVAVGVDLTQSSGRFVVNEWDFVLWLTIGIGYLRGTLVFPQFHNQRFVLGLVMLLVLLLAWSGKFWLLFEFIAEPVWHNPYYQDVYGAKLAKTAVWAIFLLPLVLWAMQQREAFPRWLLTGMLSASIVLLITLLWERGVLNTLVEHGIGYAFINSLLDASSSYRTTGIFSEMHTGGEVIDGVIILLLPFCLWGLVQASHVFKLFSAAALLGLLYITFAGFTRTTYIAVFVSIFLFVILHLYQRRIGSISIMKTWFSPVLLFTLLCVLALKLTGSIGGLIIGGTLLGAALVIRIPQLNPISRILLLAFGMGFAIYQLIINHFSHQWISVSPLSVGLLGITALLLPVALVQMASRLKPVKWGQLVLVFVLLGPSLILLRQMAGGYQIGSRIETVQADLQTRFDHWQNVLDSSKKGPLTVLWGNGVGSFPRNYLLHNPDSLSHTGSFDIRQKEGAGALLLGGSADMSVGQRVSLSSETPLRVTATLYNPEQARVGVYLCQRNVIFASNTERRCTGTFFDKPDAQDISRFELTLHADEIGPSGLPLHWPLFFHIKNYTEGSVVEVQALQLWQDNIPLLNNSDFKFGSDHWYFYNDFSHLPWHIKNTYLHWFYELGILGSILYAFMFAVVFIKSHRSLPSVFPAIVAGTCGFAMIGVFGTPLDSARVSLLFYLLSFSIMATKNKQDTKNAV